MPELLIPQARSMSLIEKSQAQMRVAMKDKSHLKRWLEESGRRWLVLDALELVDALTWPAGVEALMQIIMAYRDHRATFSSGEFEDVVLVDGKKVKIARMKGEALEVPEMDQAIRFLIGQITQKDETWKLENPPR